MRQLRRDDGFDGGAQGRVDAAVHTVDDGVEGKSPHALLVEAHALRAQAAAQRGLAALGGIAQRRRVLGRAAQPLGQSGAGCACAARRAPSVGSQPTLMSCSFAACETSIVMSRSSRRSLRPPGSRHAGRAGASAR